MLASESLFPFQGKNEIFIAKNFEAITLDDVKL